MTFIFFLQPIYFFQFLFGLFFPFSIWTIFPLFYLDFYFPFLFGLLYPFSIWTFISLFYLDFYFPFLFLFTLSRLLFPFSIGTFETLFYLEFSFPFPILFWTFIFLLFFGLLFPSSILTFFPFISLFSFNRGHILDFFQIF